MDATNAAQHVTHTDNKGTGSTRDGSLQKAVHE